VDVRTGKVTVTQASGRAIFTGAAADFTSSDLIVVPGDSGQRVIRVRARNFSGQTWGSSPVRMVISDLRNANGPDVRIRVKVRTRAGSGANSEVDGFGTSAAFSIPAGVALGAGPTGSALFVSDLNGPTVRTMLLDGMVSTLAGQAGSTGSADGTGPAARFEGPHGVATDSSGNVYVADDYGNRIRRITPLGQVTTIAGSTAGEVDGSGTTARFSYPSGIAADPNGDRIYVCDRNGETIRLISYTGSGPRDKASSYQVDTIAGTAYAQGLVDGPGTSARFRQPFGIALIQGTGGVDVLLVADTGNYAIRRIDAPSPGTATVSTIAGGASDALTDGPGSVAKFLWPHGICATMNGSDLLALVADNNALRAIVLAAGNEPTQAGNYEVITLAGNAASGYVDGDGYTARFWGLYGVTVVPTTGGSTTAYLAEGNNCRIRQVTVPTGDLHIGGGIGPAGESVRLLTYDDEVPNQAAWRRTMSSADEGFETELQFYVPFGVSGFSFYAWIETDTSVVNLPSQQGCALITLAGNGYPGNNDGPGKMARLAYPAGVAAVPSAVRALYRTASGAAIRALFSDQHRIRYVDMSGYVGSLVGTENPGSGDGMAGSATFAYPEGVAVAPDGSVIVADAGNHRIRRVWPNGLVVTIAGSAQGALDGDGTAAKLNTPRGVTVTPGGVMYVGDTQNHAIRRITLRTGGDPRQSSAYTVTTVAGLMGTSGLTDGAGTLARFNCPMQLTAGADGAVYVADQANNRVRVLRDVGSTAMDVTTIPAALSSPTGVALDAAGNLYVCENGADVISRVNRVGTRDVLMGSLGSGFEDGELGKMLYPWQLALEEAGTLLLTDLLNNALRYVTRKVDRPPGYGGAGGW
jgi:sugar lactone lactonase YvrE